MSTTMKSKVSRRPRRIRDTSTGVTRSRTSGWLGAASTISESGCRVISDSSNGASMESSDPMACSTVWVGNSWSVIATSPKARSKSTRQTLRAPLSASARARLTAIVVLPTPPLGEKTVTIRPLWMAPPGPRSAT